MSTLERDTRTTKGQTVVGAFGNEGQAHDAVRALEAAGVTADRTGVVAGNVRQAREVAGSYSPQGALIGALLGVAIVGGFILAGGDSVRANAVAIFLGGFPIIGGLAFIGWLAGRARVWKEDESADAEDEVALGETLVTVMADTPDAADAVRAILERSGATDVRFEHTTEGV